MPLTRIEIEQIERTRWVAEVEIGGVTARRVTVRGGSFEEVMIQIEDAYRAYNPKPPLPVNPLAGDTLGPNDIAAQRPLNPAIDESRADAIERRRLLAERAQHPYHEPTVLREHEEKFMHAIEERRGPGRPRKE